MINRTSESALLAEMWPQSLAARGRLALFPVTRHRQVTFDPPVRNSLDASPRDVLSLQCSPFHVNTPLAPEIERLTRATGIQETDDADLALAKLRSLLARAATDVEQALRYYGAVLVDTRMLGIRARGFGSPSERERAFRCSSMFLSPPRASGRSS